MMKLQTAVVSVGHVTTDALIDSGAQVNGMRLDVYRRTGLDRKFPLQHSTITNIEGVSGEKAPVVGKVILPVYIGGLRTETEFIILRKINYDIILGISFLKLNNATLQFENSVLHLQHGVTSIQLNNIKSDKPSYVTTISNISIPAYSEFDIAVQVPISGLEKHGVLSPAPALLKQRDIIGCHCLVRNSQNKTAYRVCNPTDKIITIPKHNKVAIYSPLSDNASIKQWQDTAQINTANLNGSGEKEVASLPDPTPQQMELVAKLGCKINKEILTEDQQLELTKLLARNIHIFADSLKDIGCTDFIQHTIHVTDEIPVAQRAYTTTPLKNEIIEKHVQEWLKHDIIERSNSRYAAPVVLVLKHNAKPGSHDHTDYRCCVDYRLVNRKIIQTAYPLPQISDILDSVGFNKPRYLSTLDCYNGYFHLSLDPKSRDYTAFITGNGKYAFKRCPFGLKTSSSHFLHMMSIILQGLDQGTALRYVDDIIVMSHTFDDHLRNLQTVFDRLHRADLKLSPKKCSFAHQSINYLGHVINVNGSISIDPGKTDIIRDYPPPQEC
jgi:hypothetical protein